MSKWSEEEIQFLYKNCGKLSLKELSKELNRTPKSIKLKSNKLGLSVRVNTKVNFTCKTCNKTFVDYKSTNRTFCNSSCAATFNNKGVVRNGNKKILNTCKRCKTSTKNPTFCSKKCEGLYKREYYYKDIKEGKNIHSSIICKNYLIDTYGEKCMECGWNKKNPISNKIPIELEHIDGNSNNNCLDNLKLLCPNCHSLTPTYKALNKGKGRYKRRKRYEQGKSF